MSGRDLSGPPAQGLLALRSVKQQGTRGQESPQFAFKLISSLHLGVYRLSSGRLGRTFRSVPTLFVENIGARSGKRYTTPLMYGRDGDRFIVVASKGGSARNPSWYRNLVAHPDVTVDVEGTRLPVRARVASPTEKPRLWQLMVELWPDYEKYQQSTDREIPVVILEPRRA